MKEKDIEDIVATLKFGVLNGLSKNAHITGMKANDYTDMICQDIVDSLFDLGIVWAIEDYLKIVENMTEK